MDEERSAPFRRVRRKRQVPECPRPSVEQEGGEERDQFGHLITQELQETFQDHYAKSFWGDLQSAVKLEVPIPESRRSLTYVSELFESFLYVFVVSNLKRRAVEVSERQMSDEELELMRQAKHEEVKTLGRMPSCHCHHIFDRVESRRGYAGEVGAHLEKRLQP